MAKLTRKEKIALQQSEGRSTPQAEKKKAKTNHGIRRALALLAAIAGFLLYANTLGHDYVLDDFGLIKDNTQTKQGISAVPEIFAKSYRYGMNLTDYQLYRPLSKAMFAIEWSIAPDSPALGHWINVLMFAFLCYALFFVLNRYMNGDLLVPFITALLFAAHPLHTEVVANIKSRDEILCLLLLLGALWNLHSYVTKDSRWAFVLGIFCYCAALFAKESAITFVAIIPLMYYFFTNASKGKYLNTLAGMLVVVGIFLMFRFNALGNVKTLVPVEDNSLAGIKDFFDQKVNAIYILGVYLGKMIVPTPLMADASYNTFPPVALSSWKFLVPFIILLGGGIYALLRFKHKDPVSFCILYFLVTVSIVSNVFILIGTNYGERLMFMPSLGICMLLAILISRILRHEPASNAIENVNVFFARNSKPVLITIGIVALFSVQTIARNGEWADNRTLYTTDVKKVPNSAHMLFYLANHITTEEYLKELPDSLSRNKSRFEAIDLLTRAVTIYPKYADGYQRRGFIHVQLGDTVKGETDYIAALQNNPTHPIVYNNYGTLCFNQRRYDEAFDHFKNAVKYNPRYAHALNNLASVYGVFGQGETEAMTNDPANRDQHAANARKNYEAAISYFLQAINTDPDFAEPYRLAAVTYRNIGDNANGEKYERLYQQVAAREREK